jgi:2-(1,2-epoxy-1,2-dihydrophenyl)acetyl-CoA isomerase
MSSSAVEIERDGDVGLIWLNDPATLNAMDTDMAEAIDAALDTLGASARCLVVSGRGRGFCSGGKLAGGGLSGDGPAPDEIDVGATLESHINPLLTRLRNLPIPWISAVRGAAAGVGCSLALAGDLIVASETAYFLQAFSRVGLVPDGGSSFLLTRAAGRARAMEMMLLGDKVPAAQALEWGLINRVVADADLEATALKLAHRLAAGPTRTLGMIREVVWTGAEASWSEALDAERRLQRDAGRTADFGEGVLAFLEKRPARYTGA